MKTSKLIAAILVGMMGLQHANAQELKMNKAKFNCWVYKSEGELIASGSFHSLGNSTISIMPLNQNITMPDLIRVSEIESMSFRKKGRVGRGVLIGLGAGAGVGLILSYSMLNSSDHSMFSQPDEYGDDMGKSVLAALACTAAGTIIGAVIGSQKLEFQINRKQNRYQRQKEEIRKFATTQ